MFRRGIFLIIIVFIFAINLFATSKSIDLNDIDGYNVAIKSAVYPGLGQFAMGETSKGYLFASIQTMAIVGTCYSWYVADQKYDEYRERGYKYSNLYDDYEDKMTQMYVFIGIGLVNWVYSIYDAYKSGDEYFYTQDRAVSMMFNDNNIYITYSRKI